MNLQAIGFPNSIKLTQYLIVVSKDHRLFSIPRLSQVQTDMAEDQLADARTNTTMDQNKTFILNS
jgi:hypothetical protein